jgi:hypothetical protein
MNDQITHMLGHAQSADRWTWPYIMEATIRSGAQPDEVFSAFDADADERAKTLELLDGPAVWRQGASCVS